MELQQTIEIVNEADEVKFKNKVNDLLNTGWRIESTSCGFVNSEAYDFCNVYQAILTKTVGV